MSTQINTETKEEKEWINKKGRRTGTLHFHVLENGKVEIRSTDLKEEPITLAWLVHTLKNKFAGAFPIEEPLLSIPIYYDDTSHDIIARIYETHRISEEEKKI